MSDTPACLSCEDPTLIFVFGSNAQGNHAGGAAKHAREQHGAIMGKGYGYQGNSYAIDTMSGLDELKYRVAAFLEAARINSIDRYFVTAIGCGIAGYTFDQIRPLFAGAPPNCILPAGWRTT